VEKSTFCSFRTFALQLHRDCRLHRLSSLTRRAHVAGKPLKLIPFVL
jgi:hypothetical protein